MPADRGWISGSDPSPTIRRKSFCSEARLGARKRHSVWGSITNGHALALPPTLRAPGPVLHLFSLPEGSCMVFLALRSGRSPNGRHSADLEVQKGPFCSQKRDLEVPGPHTALSLPATEGRAGIGPTSHHILAGGWAPGRAPGRTRHSLWV